MLLKTGKLCSRVLGSTKLPSSTVYIRNCSRKAGIVASSVKAKSSIIGKIGSLGNTPLWYAARYGQEEVVKMLLAQDDIDPNELDLRDQTPLLWAALNGHEGVVKMLLSRGDTNPNRCDSFDRTPLWMAVADGHSGVVKMLLERDDTDPNRFDQHNRTPLELAINDRDMGLVKMLLGRDDIDPNWSWCPTGRTALMMAAIDGQEGVVKLLLARDDIEPNKEQEFGQTALGYATFNRHEGVVRLLLDHERVSNNEKNRYGQTPLSIAVRYGHVELISLLQALADAAHEAKKTHRGLASLRLSDIVLIANVWLLQSPLLLNPPMFFFPCRRHSTLTLPHLFQTIRPLPYCNFHLPERAYDKSAAEKKVPLLGWWKKAAYDGNAHIYQLPVRTSIWIFLMELCRDL